MSLPLSIVVCTRNRVANLRRCVEALFSVRTSQDWELIIVDNGSDDGTADFLRSLVTSQRKPVVETAIQIKRGLTAARNTGWKSASAEIIAFTDDDCYVAPDYVDEVIAAFSNKPDLGFIGGRILLYDPTDLRMTIQERKTRLELRPQTYVPIGVIQGANMAFRRQTLERIGGFNENLGPGTKFNCEDLEAVASASWANVSGEYNPGPTVYHHHGRKTHEDKRRILTSYAQGHGAYHANFLLRRDSRSVYTRAWTKNIYLDLRGAIGTARRGRVPAMSGLLQEIYGALKYTIWHYRTKPNRI